MSVVSDYFEALARRDIEAMAALWAPDGTDHTEQARASIRKLAALEPSAAWPGHGDAVTGDVRGRLEGAAS
jgi:glyoxylase-like metal-dependent hydrolase (beta-lactamase superfamily II)